MDDPLDVLTVLQDILDSDRSFHQTIRLLHGGSRNHVVAAHMHNTSVALRILHTFMTQPQTTMVMNIPISMDLSGNFLDPVPIVPTPAQVAAATEAHLSVPANTTCAICQDEVVCATQIRACGHTFHGACIGQWFQMNPRCPVCRYDIRSLQSARPTSQ
jgi:hypothetical protein